MINYNIIKLRQHKHQFQAIFLKILIALVNGDLEFIQLEIKVHVVLDGLLDFLKYIVIDYEFPVMDKLMLLYLLSN